MRENLPRSPYKAMVEGEVMHHQSMTSKKEEKEEEETKHRRRRRELRGWEI